MVNWDVLEKRPGAVVLDERLNAQAAGSIVSMRAPSHLPRAAIIWPRFLPPRPETLVQAVAAQPRNINITQNEVFLPECAEVEREQIRDAGNANVANGAG